LAKYKINGQNDKILDENKLKIFIPYYNSVYQFLSLSMPLHNFPIFPPSLEKSIKVAPFVQRRLGFRSSSSSMPSGVRYQNGAPSIFIARK